VHNAGSDDRQSTGHNRKLGNLPEAHLTYRTVWRDSEVGLRNVRPRKLAEVISVEALAQLVELSPFHFSRVFKQSTGLTPLQFVTREWHQFLLLPSAFSLSARQPEPFRASVSARRRHHADGVSRRLMITYGLGLQGVPRDSVSLP
jgi:hypothetical protein